MINILYFASVRESLDTENESIELPAQVTTVAELIDHLVELHGDLWAQVLRDTSVLIAVNQTVAKLSAQIADGDELAFFPPVTGG